MPRPRLVAPSEKEIQHGIRRLLENLGFSWYNLSQPRATKQTAGLPDAIAFGRGRTLFIEVKRKPNKPTPAQIGFGEEVAAAEGSWVCWYSTREAGDWLRENGIARITPL